MNNTNQIATTWVDVFTNIGAVPFTVIACVIVAYVFRSIPKFPNRLLWVVCAVVGASIFPILAWYSFKHLEAAPVLIVKYIITGLVLGLGAWAFHDKIFSIFEDKIPVLKNVVAAMDSEEKTNPPVDPAQPKP